MAFNFNWSPLIADTSRARDMLTSALNKSPKPPIIVDDILVTELNLGSIPPELEILEIGDLAEDRFRGIFKMSYTGDAFLTLKTRVQANPLNTYLSTKPSFASPQPLAAASGLTIPLAITLSDIRLSGFVILVFSKQKGITLVFRDDPLESLKVSSTFDSIQFVRDYLQKEIEAQLRLLFMEDLPAIIHRLSLRLWVPDYASKEEEEAARDADSGREPVDPLASPPQNAFDDDGFDETDFSSLSLEHHAAGAISQKNLLRLAALTDSHRTLSLFTPSIRDSVFRAWACSPDSREAPGHVGSSFTLASLNRHHRSPHTVSLPGSSAISPSEYSASRRSSLRATSSFTSLHSATGVAGAKPRARKRKRRIVDLRKPKPADEGGDRAAEEHDESRSTTPSSTEPSSYSAFASEEHGHGPSHEREGELVTPPDSPEKKREPAKARMQTVEEAPEIVSPRPRPVQTPLSGNRLQRILLDDAAEDVDSTPRAAPPQRPAYPDPRPERPSLHEYWPRIDEHRASAQHKTHAYTFPSNEKQQPLAPPYSFSDGGAGETGAFHSTGGILEQAWMMKMATEIARRAAEERAAAAASGAGAAEDGGRPPVLMSGPGAGSASTTSASLHKHLQDADWGFRLRHGRPRTGGHGADAQLHGDDGADADAGLDVDVERPPPPAYAA